MPKKKRKSKAWKNLLKAHRKGPKTVKLSVPRRSKGVDALLIPENIAHVQLVLERGNSVEPIAVVMFKVDFQQLGLTIGTVRTTNWESLSRSANAFKKTFTALSHNDRIMGLVREVKTEGLVRRCFISGHYFDECDATIRIKNSQTVERQLSMVTEHVEQLFQKTPAVLCQVEREMM